MAVFTMLIYGYILICIVCQTCLLYLLYNSQSTPPTYFWLLYMLSSFFPLSFFTNFLGSAFCYHAFPEHETNQMYLYLSYYKLIF